MLTVNNLILPSLKFDRQMLEWCQSCESSITLFNLAFFRSLSVVMTCLVPDKTNLTEYISADAVSSTNLLAAVDEDAKAIFGEKIDKLTPLEGLYLIVTSGKRLGKNAYEFFNKCLLGRLDCLENRVSPTVHGRDLCLRNHSIMALRSTTSWSRSNVGAIVTLAARGARAIARGLEFRSIFDPAAGHVVRADVGALDPATGEFARRSPEGDSVLRCFDQGGMGLSLTQHVSALSDLLVQLRVTLSPSRSVDPDPGSDTSNDRTCRLASETIVQNCILHMVQGRIHEFMWDNMASYGLDPNGVTLEQANSSTGPRFEIGRRDALEQLTANAQGVGSPYAIPRFVRENEAVVFVTESRTSHSNARKREIQRLLTRFPAHRMTLPLAGGGGNPHALLIDSVAGTGAHHGYVYTADRTSAVLHPQPGLAPGGQPVVRQDGSIGGDDTAAGGSSMPGEPGGPHHHVSYTDELEALNAIVDAVQGWAHVVPSFLRAVLLCTGNIHPTARGYGVKKTSRCSRTWQWLLAHKPLPHGWSDYPSITEREFRGVAD